MQTSCKTLTGFDDPPFLLLSISTECVLRPPNIDRFEFGLPSEVGLSIESNAFAMRRTDGSPPLANSSRRIL
ncbi:hypothetical protein AB6A40_011824 [Gnathostoma spinigerum]|uniref:Uncharacterized protein n=1 Tax=Gnathostoma spinigerum TaxID=75299 RepID=A0ABD6EYT6_9BILA